MTAANRVTGHTRLQKRTHGSRWYVKYRLADGRQVQKLLGPAWTERSRPPAGYYTRRTAEEALQELLADARRGTLPESRPRSGHTLGDACAEWLRYIERERERAASTVRDYTNVVNGALLPEFGRDTPLEKITTERIDEWRERMLTETELSRRTVQKNLVLLGGVMKRAKRRKWISYNPAEDAEKVSVKRSGDFNVLTPVEVEAVARVAESPQDAALFKVAAYTGLRLGELRALRWEDVDFQRHLVLVRRNFTHGAERAPKSGKVRSVPLIDPAARVLDTLSQREHFTEPDDLVFCSVTGEHLDDDRVRDGFYAALEAAGLGDKRAKPDPIVFHDLRHTFGTLAVGAWDLPKVQAAMGHANIATTMIYVHSQPRSSDAEALTRVVAAASGAAEPESVSPSVSRTAEFQSN